MNIEQFLKSKGLAKQVAQAVCSEAKLDEYVYKKHSDHIGKSLESVYYSKDEPPFKNKLVHFATFHGGILVE